MSIPPPTAGVFGSGMSTTNAPIVAAVEAIETAFWTASRTTRVGSIMPAFFMSIKPSSGLFTLTPYPGLPDSTCANKASLFSPALPVICRNGCFKIFFKICRPALIESAPDALISLATFTNVTPPPGKIPSASAALVAATASSTRNFFSSISVSLTPPTLITAT